MAHRILLPREVAQWLAEFREGDDTVGPTMVVGDDKLLELTGNLHGMATAMGRQPQAQAVHRALEGVQAQVRQAKLQHEYQLGNGACIACGTKLADHKAYDLPEETLALGLPQGVKSTSGASDAPAHERQGTTVTQVTEEAAPTGTAQPNATPDGAPNLVDMAAQVASGQPVAEAEAPAKAPRQRKAATPKAEAAPPPSFDRHEAAPVFTAGMDPTKHEVKWPGGFLTVASRNRTLKILVGLFDMQQAPQKVAKVAKEHSQALGRWVAVCQHGNFLSGTNGNVVYQRMFRPWEWCGECAKLNGSPAPAPEASYIATRATEKAEKATAPKAAAKGGKGKAKGKGKATAAKGGKKAEEAPTGAEALVSQAEAQPVGASQ